MAHLIYTDQDYARLGTRIKCNPAIKTIADRNALREAILDGTITVVGTDHAPHLLSEKEGGSKKAVSGMPMVQFSLSGMLQLCDEGVLTPEIVIQLMCHNPARLFCVDKRGFLRPGYKADFVLLRHDEPMILNSSQILSRCGWSPREGDTFNWKVCQTWVNGQLVWDGQTIACGNAGIQNPTIWKQQIHSILSCSSPTNLMSTYISTSQMPYSNMEMRHFPY